LARCGVNMVIHDRTLSSELEKTVQEVEALGVQALGIAADLTKPDEIESMFQSIKQVYGTLDILVNSASIFKPGSILELSLKDWQLSLDVDVTAAFLCSQRAAHLMQSSAGSCIINIIDISALKPWKEYPEHSVAKAALKMLTEVLAVSLAPHIRANAVVPGPVLRDDNTSPEKWKEMGERLPLKRTGDPSDVAQAIVFLATQPYITGSTLYVNGGEHLL